MRLALAGFPFFRGGVRDSFCQLVAATRWQRQNADAALLCIHQSVDGARVGPQDYTFRKQPDVVDAANAEGSF